jgi:recombinational DNA repair protein RecR
MKEVSNCESCNNFVYDDEDECYVCDMNLDEDDMVRFLTGTFDSCPYYQPDNEYLIVRHQM